MCDGLPVRRRKVGKGVCSVKVSEELLLPWQRKEEVVPLASRKMRCGCCCKEIKMVLLL
jgi:hypothetical protein